jgi:GNAT superfamily N-acetyltransferase
MERVVRSRLAFHRALAATAPGMRVAEVEGVEALVSPAAPERSVLNAAILTRPPDDVAAFAAGLAALYRDAGVHAWTVWVPPAAASATRGLEAAGHAFDGEPVGMWRALTDADVRSAGDELDLDPSPRFATLAELNDLAYGTGGSFARAAEGAVGGPAHLYVARQVGQPVTCLMTLDVDTDCVVDLVTTRADARGRGLASRLLGRALADARTRGQETTTLVATAKGAPVYERQGYRTMGRIEMWERRESPRPG